MVLTRRQLYMLPTRHGLLFCLALLVIFLASANYNNGLAYALTFLLAGMALVAMLHTHRNVSGLDVRVLSAAPGFVGDTIFFRVNILNPSDLYRVAIWLHCGEHRQIFHIDPQSQTDLEVPVAATSRGYIDCPPIRLSSAFPIGLQYTWSGPIRGAARGIVYPRPEGEDPLPPSLDPAVFSQSGLRAEGDDFAGLRDYVSGDPPRHVHWKAVASHQRLLTKQFRGEAAEQLWLRWEDTVGPTESRLSQLTKWLIEAEQSDRRYGLRLPGQEVPPQQGPAHYHRCLTLLALWGLEPA